MSDVTQRIERLRMYVQSHPAKDYIDEVKWLCRLALAQEKVIETYCSLVQPDDPHAVGEGCSDCDEWAELEAARRDPA